MLYKFFKVIQHLFELLSFTLKITKTMFVFIESIDLLTTIISVWFFSLDGQNEIIETILQIHE